VAHEEEEERGGPEEVWRAKTRAAVQMLLRGVGSENTFFLLYYQMASGALLNGHIVKEGDWVGHVGG
jgi:hypothetical protein